MAPLHQMLIGVASTSNIHRDKKGFKWFDTLTPISRRPSRQILKLRPQSRRYPHLRNIIPIRNYRNVGDGASMPEVFPINLIASRGPCNLRLRSPIGGVKLRQTGIEPEGSLLELHRSYLIRRLRRSLENYAIPSGTHRLPIPKPHIPAVTPPSRINFLRR